MGMPIDHLRGAGTCICEFLSAVPAAGRPRTLLADPSIILLAATSSDSDQSANAIEQLEFAIHQPPATCNC